MRRKSASSLKGGKARKKSGVRRKAADSGSDQAETGLVLQPIDLIKRLIRAKGVTDSAKERLINEITGVKGPIGIIEAIGILRIMFDYDVSERDAARVLGKKKRWVVLAKESLRMPKKVCVVCWQLYDSGATWIFKLVRGVQADKQLAFLTDVMNRKLSQSEAKAVAAQYAAVPGIGKLDIAKMKSNIGKLELKRTSEASTDMLADSLYALLVDALTAFDSGGILEDFSVRNSLSNKQLAAILGSKEKKIWDLRQISKLDESLRTSFSTLSNKDIPVVALIARVPEEYQRQVVEKIDSNGNGSVKGIKRVIRTVLPEGFTAAEHHAMRIKASLDSIKELVTLGEFSPKVREVITSRVRSAIVSHKPWLQA